MDFDELLEESLSLLGKPIGINGIVDGLEKLYPNRLKVDRGNNKLIIHKAGARRELGLKLHAQYMTIVKDGASYIIKKSWRYTPQKNCSIYDIMYSIARWLGFDPEEAAKMLKQYQNVS